MAGVGRLGGMHATPKPTHNARDNKFILESMYRQLKGEVVEMSKEQDSRRKAKESARRVKSAGHQTRRTRGGKKQKRRKKNTRAHIKIFGELYIYVCFSKCKI